MHKASLLNIEDSRKIIEPSSILGALFFLLPFGGKIVPPVIILLVLSVLVFSNKRNWMAKIAERKSFYLPLLVFFLLYIVGVLWSSNINSAFERIEHKMVFMVLPIIVPLIKLDKGQILGMFKIFTYSCLLILTLSFIDFAIVSLTHDEYIILGEIPAGNRPGSVYEYMSQQFLIVDVHRTYFSLYLIISLSYVLSYFSDYIKLRGKSANWIGYLSLLLIMSGLIVIQSKTGWILALGVIFSFLLVKSKHKLKSTIILTAALTLISIALKPFMEYRLAPLVEEIQNIASPGTDKEKSFAINLRPGSAEIRYMVYKSSLQLIKKSPFLGYGTGDVKDVLRAQNEQNGFKSIAHLNYGPHSQLLDVFLSFGTAGALVFLSVFLLPVVDLLRNSNYFAATVLLMILLSSLIESVLSRQEGIIPLALLITVFGKFIGNSNCSNGHIE
ncbi:O-antigen ligase family protein [Flagellimonas nanhaiensis]|uniref:O-antigen ligase domain-containing protein n=1 Tax=Flagellimonas nanhaiensis TaxID=2292706 RepID=A0A371JQP8_9FLAO|nr:O-antigen ligase family protein [Allomuricauda nanhaiensis]RDY59829.1 O-antigen ligase domain-containing protein [Allomuricauda nanhaiensis]